MLNSKNDIKNRILKAAATVFAEHGFKHGTVREVCKLADVNIAAINYYFGDKEKLYIKVVKYWMDVAFEKYPFDIAMDESKSLEERLKAWIQSFLFMNLYEQESPWYGKLITREIVDPTNALDNLIEDTLSPYIKLLLSIVEQLLGKGFSEESVKLYSAGILGQCFYLYTCRYISEDLFVYRIGDDIADIQKLTDYVTHFSLCALKNVSLGKEKCSDDILK